MSSAVAPEEQELKKLESMKPELKKNHAKWQKKVFLIMDSTPVQLFLMTLLMMSLFMAESWTCGNAPDADNNTLYGILCFIIVVFLIESTILTFVQNGYFLSFFFYMDVLGTLSIILDVGWIVNSFLPSGGASHKTSILRATRAAKLGARYGRLMRLLKLLRFLRFLPCFKQDAEAEKEPTMSAVRKVSNELSTVLSQRVAALVMMLVIVVPFLGYAYTDYSPNAWLKTIKLQARNTSISEDDFSTIAAGMHKFYLVRDAKLLQVSVETPWSASPYVANYVTRPILRQENVALYTQNYHIHDTATLSLPEAVNAKSTYVINILTDNTFPNEMDAMYGIVLILLVILCLFGFSASFQNAVDKLVVLPLEKMMNTLRRSATVMLKSMKAMEEADESKAGGEVKDSDTDDEELETQMLEKMVEKLARIVQHMNPGGAEIQIDDKNIDKATVSWLSQNYSQQSKIVDNAQVTVTDSDAERLRLQTLAAQHSVVAPELLNSWDFDVLDYSNEQLCEIITYIFAVQNIFDEFHVSMPVFQLFLKEICGRYLLNTYHNFKHGCDVMHTVYRLIAVSHLNAVLSHLEVFSMLIGALAHDVGHPGVNNVFLVKAKSDLALQHNDRSPLENMHCVVLYEVLSKAASNVFMGITEVQWRESRKIILTTILGTDMSHHFEQISKTQLFLEVNGEDVKKFCSGEKDTIDCMRDDNNRIFVMELLLHCADISNPYKPFAICARWADLVVDEFCLQGDREKREGLEVSPMMDRDLINLCNMQLGFIEFVVAPLINATVNVFPLLHEVGTNMLNNFVQWGERRKTDILSDEKITDKTGECRKMDERVGKFREKMAYLTDLRTLPKRRQSGVGKAETETEAAAVTAATAGGRRKSVGSVQMTVRA